MSVYNGVTFSTSTLQGSVTGTVKLSVSDMDPIDRIDFLIVVEGSDRQVADPTTAPPDGSPGPWVFEKTVLLDPTNPTTVTPRAYFRDGTTADADTVTLDPMAAGGGGTLEVQNGAAGAVQTATRLVFPEGVVPTGSETVTLDLDGRYAALEHRHPWSDLDGVPAFASRWPTLADIGINQGVSTTNQPTFTGVALQPANPAVNNTGILMSSGAFAALELQTTDGAGAGHTAIRITHATAGGVVGVGRTDPSPSYRMDVYGAMRLTDPTGSKPNGTVAPAIELLRFERAGSLNYSYNEAAEFRIGHGGPSAYGTNLELWINGGGSTGTPDTRVATFGYDGSVSVNGELSVVGDISTTGVFRDAATQSGGGIMIAHVISRSSAAGFDPNLEAPDGTFQAIWD